MLRRIAAEEKKADAEELRAKTDRDRYWGSVEQIKINLHLFL